MGYKGSPFMSPRMYRSLIMPAHIETIAYAKARGLPVIMHSCGYVEPLLPHMIEAGIDCLQVLEVKAGHGSGQAAQALWRPDLLYGRNRRARAVFQ